MRYLSILTWSVVFFTSCTPKVVQVQSPASCNRQIPGYVISSIEDLAQFEIQYKFNSDSSYALASMKDAINRPTFIRYSVYRTADSKLMVKGEFRGSDITWSDSVNLRLKTLKGIEDELSSSPMEGHDLLNVITGKKVKDSKNF